MSPRRQFSLIYVNKEVSLRKPWMSAFNFLIRKTWRGGNCQL